MPLSNKFRFIASFAFVLQMLRAKPIPLKMNERIQRLPCVKGAVALATEGLFLLDFYILQSLRQPSAATSLYTREAFC